MSSTKANNTERIRDLENEIAELKQAIDLLRADSRRQPPQAIRVIDLDIDTSPANDSTPSLPGYFIEPANGQRRSSNQNHQIHRVQGHRYSRSRKSRLAFWHGGRWFEFPQVAGAAIFRTTSVVPGLNETGANPVPGNGTAQRYRLDENNNLVVAGDPETVLTLANASTATDTWIQCKLDVDCNWWIDWEECPAEASTGDDAGGAAGAGVP